MSDWARLVINFGISEDKELSCFEVNFSIVTKPDIPSSFVLSVLT